MKVSGLNSAVFTGDHFGLREGPLDGIPTTPIQLRNADVILDAQGTSYKCQMIYKGTDKNVEDGTVVFRSYSTWGEGVM